MMNCASVARMSLATTLLVTGALCAGDWPAYRYDFARSGVTPEKIQTPLHLQWRHVSAHAPMPAWPEPGRELNRLDFDKVYHVVVSNGMVFYGSSADHQVYALDLATGRVVWHFSTGGPVRFAPAVEGDRVFVGSDDGQVYCLNAADGKVRWTFSGGPRTELLLGNGRMVSRWPIRTGVAVENGVVYFAAGTWPSEGVLLYALNASDGKPIWVNDTSGTMYVTQPHPGSFSMTGVAPQGYVLGDKGQIFVPTGRNVPAAYDRSNGKVMYYRSAPTGWGNRWGGCWNFLADGVLVGWRCHTGPDIDVLIGEYKPDPRDGIVAFDAKTGREIREVGGPLRAVIDGGTLYTSGGGKVCATDLAAWLKGAGKSKWEAPQGRTYELIMAGDVLVAGGQENVKAIDSGSGKVAWEAKVAGQARGLAVADGRLLVSTTEGDVLCYGPNAVPNPKTISLRSLPAGRPVKERELARRIVAESGKTVGHCLVLGAGDGCLLQQLARESSLTIDCVATDAAKIPAARAALSRFGQYGARVSVREGSLLNVRYPDYFADLVVVGATDPVDLGKIPAKELYRVLRPCGGVAYVLSDKIRGGSGAVRQWLEKGGVPTGEIRIVKDAVQVVRGKLPGADNWTHQYANAGRTGASSDQVARVPLKLLWFGEPGPMRLVTRHWGGPAPLCVNGRMFVIGQRSLIAVDAYNGRQHWRRDFPLVGWWPIRSKGSSTAADSDSVYLATGKTCLRLDAATGETVQTYNFPSEAAAQPKWDYIAADGGRVLGAAGGDGEAKFVFLTGKDGSELWAYAAKGAVNVNALSMDAERVYLIDQTSAGAISHASKRGRSIKVETELIALDGASGQVAWRTKDSIAGRNALWLSNGVLLATASGSMTGYDAATGKQLYARGVNVRRFPVIAGDTIYIEPLAFDLRTGEPKTRGNPFTSGKTGWSFQRSYGCGAIAGGANLLMFRSGTLGFYDLASDGGVFNFGGVRAGCYVNAIAANGLVLAPPSDAGCTCSYSFRTTVALVPTAEERDWSIFYDRLPNTSVTQAAFNLGAPGDRRDKDGRIWLALPRPKTRSHRRDMAIPFRFTMIAGEGFGPYRRNADLLRVEGTDRPWVYASGLKGLRRADLDLEVLSRGYTTWPTKEAPTADGQLADSCWDGYKTIRLGADGTSVTLRHDAEKLYLAYHRPPAKDAAGKPRAWRAATKGEDANVWQDDSFEVYCSTVPKSRTIPPKKCLHLGVSASGARYDALWTYVTPTLPTCNIPPVDVVVDGKADDWADQGLRISSLTGRFRNEFGKMRDQKDFDPCFRIGWNEDGLVLLAEVQDNVVHEWENESQLWIGDCIDIFLASKASTSEYYRCIATPGAGPEFKGRCVLTDRRKEKGGDLTVQVAGQKTPQGYVLEVLLPWANLRMQPTVGAELAMQLMAADDDVKGGRYRFRSALHPAGDPTGDPSAYVTLRLANEPSAAIEFKRSPKRDRYRLYTAVGPHAFPVNLPSIGGQPENAEYAAEWASAVRPANDAFTAELAIPWRTFSAAGLDRNRLMLNLKSRGPLKHAPSTGGGFVALVVVPPDKAQPRNLSLRLHFAEIDGAKPGQRVFDVKIQGQDVLKDFDVVKAAGGPNRATAKTFEGVVATRALTIELVPKAKEVTAATAPIISAIEILRGRTSK